MKNAFTYVLTYTDLPIGYKLGNEIHICFQVFYPKYSKAAMVLLVCYRTGLPEYGLCGRRTLRSTKMALGLFV